MSTALVISKPAKVLYEGGWHYKGYHGTPSICVLRLYQPCAEDDPLDAPESLPPAFALFTEA